MHVYLIALHCESVMFILNLPVAEVCSLESRNIYNILYGNKLVFHNRCYCYLYVDLRVVSVYIL